MTRRLVGFNSADWVWHDCDGPYGFVRSLHPFLMVTPFLWSPAAEVFSSFQRQRLVAVSQQLQAQGRRDIDAGKRGTGMQRDLLAVSISPHQCCRYHKLDVMQPQGLPGTD